MSDALDDTSIPWDRQVPGKKPEVLSNSLENDKTALLVYLLHSFKSSF